MKDYELLRQVAYNIFTTPTYKTLYAPGTRARMEAIADQIEQLSQEPAPALEVSSPPLSVEGCRKVIHELAKAYVGLPTQQEDIDKALDALQRAVMLEYYTS